MSPTPQPAGNYYDKYHTANPVARRLMQGFLGAFDALAARVPVADALEIDAQRKCRCAGDDQLRLFLLRQRFERVVIDVFLRVQAVAHHVEPLAAHVERHAVGQVAAFGQAHAHDRVARLEHGEEHALVGLRARVRLHVGGFGAEELLHAVDGELFHHVHVFATAVVTLAGVALGVLVGQLGALRGHHGRGRVVLGGNQLDVVFLTLIFLLDGGKDFGIDLVDRIAAAFEHGECLV